MASEQANGVMLQWFHWYTTGDGSHWRTVAARAKEMAEMGITAVWLPPAYKGAAGVNDVGYGVYDMYDLGEFQQKGTVRTKYGTKDEYLGAIAELQKAGIQVYADMVFNHRDGADELETVRATPYWPEGRQHAKGEMVDVEVWTKFTFPGRAGKYSAFQWDWKCFDAVSFAANRSEDAGAIYLFEGKQWDDAVAAEKGNYDYLMGCDLDLQSEVVLRECWSWTKWYVGLTGIDGVRLDAVKHMSARVFAGFVDGVREQLKPGAFVVGEYWTSDVGEIKHFLDVVKGRMSLFDVPLHMNFHRASKAGAGFDMRTMFDGTLVKESPTHAVTFVDNHDSQPLQALESTVEGWFKPLAYALILLREGGYPCVFIADVEGATYEDKGVKVEMASHRFLVERFVRARRSHGWGRQVDYFDDPHVVGWARLGDEAHHGVMAVVMSNGAGGEKRMEVGPRRRMTDVTGHVAGVVESGEDGFGVFGCLGGSVSVWLDGN